MTYTLYADTNQAKDASDTAVLYDLVYEDGAPEIEQLNGSYTDADGVTHELGYTARVLGAEEYDFTRVKVRKLIDGNTVLINTNTGTRLRNTFKRTQYVGTYENPSATHYGDSTYSLSWLRESTTAIDAFTSIEKFVYHDAWSELSEE